MKTRLEKFNTKYARHPLRWLWTPQEAAAGEAYVTAASYLDAFFESISNRLKQFWKTEPKTLCLGWTGR